jgi:hypothetical protein
MPSQAVLPGASVKRRRVRNCPRRTASRSQTARMQNMLAAAASTRRRLNRARRNNRPQKLPAGPTQAGLMRKTSSKSRPFCAGSRVNGPHEERDLRGDQLAI